MHDPMFLSQKSVKATSSDTDVIADLYDTLAHHRNECIGMAANMIGVKKNIIIVNLGLTNMIMVNPVITSKKNPYTTSEGCLSLLGDPRPVVRFEEIEVTYQDSKFKSHKGTFKGLTAQIIQHEVDHCNGILI